MYLRVRERKFQCHCSKVISVLNVLLQTISCDDSMKLFSMVIESIGHLFRVNCISVLNALGCSSAFSFSTAYFFIRCSVFCPSYATPVVPTGDSVQLNSVTESTASHENVVEATTKVYTEHYFI